MQNLFLEVKNKLNEENDANKEKIVKNEEEKQVFDNVYKEEKKENAPKLKKKK